jgi:hypothetical protein
MAEREATAALPTADEAVADYLRRHPGFLEAHPDLLDLLTPPALRRGDGVADMQRFMLQRLQSELAKLRMREGEIVASSRANQNSGQRVHAAVLAMLEARTFEHLIEILTTDLAVHLEVDAIFLAFEALDRITPGQRTSGVRMLAKGRIDQLTQGGREVVLHADAPGDAELFGAAATLVRSQALVRLNLRREAPRGLIAFGARAPDRFHTGQGTELLVFLGGAIERIVRGWLER